MNTLGRIHLVCFCWISQKWLPYLISQVSCSSFITFSTCCLQWLLILNGPKADCIFVIVLQYSSPFSPLLYITLIFFVNLELVSLYIAAVYHSLYSHLLEGNSVCWEIRRLCCISVKVDPFDFVTLTVFPLFNGKYRQLLDVAILRETWILLSFQHIPEFLTFHSTFWSVPCFNHLAIRPCCYRSNQHRPVSHWLPC